MWYVVVNCQTKILAVCETKSEAMQRMKKHYIFKEYIEDSDEWDSLCERVYSDDDYIEFYDGDCITNDLSNTLLKEVGLK